MQRNHFANLSSQKSNMYNKSRRNGQRKIDTANWMKFLRSIIMHLPHSKCRTANYHFLLYNICSSQQCICIIQHPYSRNIITLSKCIQSRMGLFCKARILILLSSFHGLNCSKIVLRILSWHEIVGLNVLCITLVGFFLHVCFFLLLFPSVS